MKPEISQVLISSPKEKSTSSPQTTPCIITLPTNPSASTSNCCLVSKWLIALAVLLSVVAVFLAGGAMLLRYEGKLEEYETRISILEAELTELFDHLGVAGNGEDDDLSFDDLNSLEAKGLKYFPSKEDYSSREVKEGDDNVREEEQVVFGEIKKIQSADEHTLSRSKRQATIRDGSYGTGNDQNVPTVGPTESEGLRLYESLIATRGRGEPTSPSFQESSGSNIKPYHRQSAAWSEKDERNSQLQLKSGDLSSDDDDVLYHRSSRRHIFDSSNGDQTFTRSSRVPATGDQIYYRAPGTREYQYPPLQRMGRGEGEVIARVHQENPTDRRQMTRTHPERPRHDPDHVIAAANQDDIVTSFAESRRYKGGYSKQNQRRNQQRNRVNESGAESDSSSASGSDEFTFTKAEAFAEIPKTYAAHYVADVSNYSLSHRHYEGNGRLRNADGIFSSWKPANWMAASGISKEVFSLSGTGVLTVKKDGLYYIYAQIHYLDDHDINGFMIQVNTEPFLQCTTMTETRSTKSNTCFTGGVTHLKENDRILLRDMETNRYSILKPEKSFFGLMRIGNAVGR